MYVIRVCLFALRAVRPVKARSIFTWNEHKQHILWVSGYYTVMQSWGWFVFDSLFNGKNRFVTMQFAESEAEMCFCAWSLTVALFKKTNTRRDNICKHNAACQSQSCFESRKTKPHPVWTRWCNWRLCCLDANTEFMRGREEGYQKGKEQHVGENIDLTGGKWARSCQNKSIWRDSNTD